MVAVRHRDRRWCLLPAMAHPTTKEPLRFPKNMWFIYPKIAVMLSEVIYLIASFSNENSEFP